MLGMGRDRTMPRTRRRLLPISDVRLPTEIMRAEKRYRIGSGLRGGGIGRGQEINGRCRAYAKETSHKGRPR